MSLVTSVAVTVLTGALPPYCPVAGEAAHPASFVPSAWSALLPSHLPTCPPAPHTSPSLACTRQRPAGHLPAAAAAPIPLICMCHQHWFISVSFLSILTPEPKFSGPGSFSSWLYLHIMHLTTLIASLRCAVWRGWGPTDKSEWSLSSPGLPTGHYRPGFGGCDWVMANVGGTQAL